MAVFTHVSFFLPAKFITIFPCFFPPWYVFIIISNGCIIFHFDVPGVACANKH